MAVFATPAVPTFVAAAAFTGVPVCDYTAIDNAAAEQAAHLNAEVQRHLSGQDLEPAFVHARGDPATELLRVAQTVQADVIVVGRSTKLRHPLAGPLGRRLITKRTAPVVVIVP